MDRDLKPNRSHTRKVYAVFIWHSFFLALTMSMLDLNTVFPALVSELTSSKILFGALYSMLLGAPMILSILFSHILKRFAYKKRYLLLGIYLRAGSFLGMSLFTLIFAKNRPAVALSSFFLWMFVFSASGEFAGITYADMIGKLLTGKSRTGLFASKQLAGSLAALLGGLIIVKLLNPDTLPFPDNYAVSLAIGSAGLMVASFGFYFLREPPSETASGPTESFSTYLKKVPRILSSDPAFKRFIVIENLASFSVMILPFYMVYAKEYLQVDNSYIGKYLVFQIVGTLFSNVVWGTIAKKTNARNVVRFCVLTGGLLPLAAIGLARLGPDFYAILFLLLGFIISGRRIGFDAYLLELAPENSRTEYLGIRGSLNVFAILLPVLGGFFINLLGYVVTFSVVSLVMLSMGVLLRRDAHAFTLPGGDDRC